jgi:hypothetical protein
MKPHEAMKIVLSGVALSLAATASAQTQGQQEALFVARVERITLAPPGGATCPELCPSTFSRNADGTTHVCVSNDGGCQKTEVQVERVLLGTLQPGPFTFDARIGEWGDVHFPVTHAPVLVHVRPGLVEWAPVTSKDGRQLVRLKAFRLGVVAGVDLSTLALNGEDAVALDAVAERLATAPH